MSDSTLLAPQCYLDSIDAAAEREAAAMERMAELLDEELPMSDLRKRQEGFIGPGAVHNRYARQENIDTWSRICAAYAGGRCPIRVGVQLHWRTREDRQRLKRERAERRDRVRAAAQNQRALSREAAAELLGLTISGFDKLVRREQLPRVRIGRAVHIDAGALVTYAERTAHVR
jgi:predicted DNA-binding transcriptional regulator AlpA